MGYQQQGVTRLARVSGVFLINTHHFPFLDAPQLYGRDDDGTQQPLWPFRPPTSRARFPTSRHPSWNGNETEPQIPFSLVQLQSASRPPPSSGWDATEAPAFPVQHEQHTVAAAQCADESLQDVSAKYPASGGPHEHRARAEAHSGHACSLQQGADRSVERREQSPRQWGRGGRTIGAKSQPIPRARGQYQPVPPVAEFEPVAGGLPQDSSTAGYSHAIHLCHFH